MKKSRWNMASARLRLLAFLPLATGIAASLLVFASALVSSLEQTFVPDAIPVVGFQRIESGCDPVSRTMQRLSRAMMGCESGTRCGTSRLVCPISAVEGMELEPEEPSPKVFVF
jgi:hypothetical protein